MLSMKQKIIPNLWFDRQAEEAAHFYTSVFKNSGMGLITRATGVGYEITGLEKGTVVTVEFMIEGMQFVGINGGPLFKLNPSISFMIACETPAEVDDLWSRLSPGGKPLMELGAYPFSERYGWIEDRYGLSWQVMAMGNREIVQKIIPTLMFVGDQYGRAEEAARLYTAVFQDARMGDIDRYGPGQEPDKAGAVVHESFTLEGQAFAAMDSAYRHDFSFNEAISLMIRCETQDEIDYYWAKLTSGGRESACGWLKDKFGVSWQVVPSVLDEMLHDHDRRKVEALTGAFLQMKKLDIAKLMKAFHEAPSS